MFFGNIRNFYGNLFIYCCCQLWSIMSRNRTSNNFFQITSCLLFPRNTLEYYDHVVDCFQKNDYAISTSSKNVLSRIFICIMHFFITIRIKKLGQYFKFNCSVWHSEIYPYKKKNPCYIILNIMISNENGYMCILASKCFVCKHWEIKYAQFKLK